MPSNDQKLIIKVYDENGKLHAIFRPKHRESKHFALYEAKQLFLQNFIQEGAVITVETESGEHCLYSITFTSRILEVKGSGKVEHEKA